MFSSRQAESGGYLFLVLFAGRQPISVRRRIISGLEMEFRLVVRDDVPPGYRAGKDAKHRIRQEVHPQKLSLMGYDFLSSRVRYRARRLATMKSLSLA